MRRIVLFALPFVCLLAVQAGHAQLSPLFTVSLTTETANNTSACVSNGSPSYCYAVGTPALPLLTSNTNWDNAPTGAQTHDVDAFPGHVSPLLISSLMPKVSGQNWNGQVVCEYQPWFSVNPNSSFGGVVYPYNSHIDIDYDEDAYDATNNPFNSAGPNQDSVMIARGCNISFIDFYGSIDASQQFNLGTTNNVYGDLLSRYNPNTATYPMKFGILEDENAFRTDCDGAPNEVTCVEADLEADMAYIYTNYIPPSRSPYWTDNGVNVVGFFGACGDFAHLNCSLNSRPNDWDNIWQAVSTYVNSAPRNYNMKFIFEYSPSGGFGYPSSSSGTYAWPQPYTADTDDNFLDDPATQLNWCDPLITTCNGGIQGATAYLDRFYYDASQNLGEMAVGLLYSGFDDSNAGWTKDRVIAQQCGHVLLNTANEVSKGGSYWSTHAIPYMQVATWNDYEEGTETESGISNCYNSVVASLSNGTPPATLSWTLGTNDSANRNGTNFANTDTIYEFALWSAPYGVKPVTLTLRGHVAGNISSIGLPALNLAAGSSYEIYVEMIGLAMMQNVMAAGVGPYTP